MNAEQIEELMDDIKEAHRLLHDQVNMETSITNRMKGACRRFVGRRFIGIAMNAQQLKEVRTAGKELYDHMVKYHLRETGRLSKRMKWDDAWVTDDLITVYRKWCLPAMMALDSIQPFRNSLEKKLTDCAKLLPVYDWAVSIKGLGDLSLSRIIGETGDLCNYPTPAKLWKRLGLGVTDGRCDRRVKDKAIAEAMGYCSRRRSFVWVVGECLMKQTGSYYKMLYDKRKVQEAVKIPDKKDKKGKMIPGILGHRHNRAKRYMEKQLLRDLWCQWQIATGHADRVQEYAPDPIRIAG